MCLIVLHMANDINTLVYNIIHQPKSNKQQLWKLKNLFRIIFITTLWNIYLDFLYNWFS